MAASMRFRSHSGWSRRTHSASAVGSSRRMQPWLKSRRAREKRDCAGVPCMYTFSALGKMNLARPSEFLGPGFWRTKRRPETTRVEVLRVDGQGRRVVVAGRHDLQVLAREVARVAARVRDDLARDDAGGRVPVRAEDHVLQAVDEDRRLVLERLADDDVHAQRLVGGLRVGRPQAEERDVHEQVRVLAHLGQPAHALHGELDLAHAMGEGDVQAGDRSRTEDAVRLHAVAALEALHGVDERRVVGACVGGGASGRSPNAWRRAATAARPSQGWPGSSFFRPAGSAGTAGGSWPAADL